MLCPFLIYNLLGAGREGGVSWLWCILQLPAGASLAVSTTDASRAARGPPPRPRLPLAVRAGGSKDQNLLPRDCGRELGLCAIWEKSDHRAKPLRGQVSDWGLG